jgi:hypothetical protein
MDLWQFTPLHEAASKNRVEVCSLLLSHGADPTLLNCLMYKMSYYRFGEMQVLVFMFQCFPREHRGLLPSRPQKAPSTIDRLKIGRVAKSEVVECSMGNSTCLQPSRQVFCGLCKSS